MRPAVIALICAGALAGLTLLVAGGLSAPGEIEPVRLIVSWRSEPLTALIQGVTFITSAAPALLVTLALSAIELRGDWRRGRYAGSPGRAARAAAASFAYWPALAYAGALACNIALRVAIGRLPPEVDYIPHVLPELRADFQRFAFPSGHAGAAVVAYGSAALLIASRWPRARHAAGAAALAIIGATGFGRVYLGVHWPTDVAGGFLLAGMWLALSVHLRRRATQRAGLTELNTT